MIRLAYDLRLLPDCPIATGIFLRAENKSRASTTTHGGALMHHAASRLSALCWLWEEQSPTSDLIDAIVPIRTSSCHGYCGAQQLCLSDRVVLGSAEAHETARVHQRAWNHAAVWPFATYAQQRAGQTFLCRMVCCSGIAPEWRRQERSWRRACAASLP